MGPLKQLLPHPLIPSVLAPIHIISYSLLLGTQFYQSFINTKLCFQALPRPAFISLQKRLFPVYFRMQSSLLLLTILTYLPFGPYSLFHDVVGIVCFSLAGLTALLNLFIYGPGTRKVMLERAQKGTAVDGDGADGDTEDATVAKQLIDRRFSRNHAMCIHLNLISIVATVWHGIRLASRLRLDVE